jgi:hypothetical protein
MKGGKYIQRPFSSKDGFCSMKFSFVYSPELTFRDFNIGISLHTRIGQQILHPYNTFIFVYIIIDLCCITDIKNSEANFYNNSRYLSFPPHRTLLKFKPLFQCAGLNN